MLETATNGESNFSTLTDKVCHVKDSLWHLLNIRRGTVIERLYIDEMCSIVEALGKSPKDNYRYHQGEKLAF